LNNVERNLETCVPSWRRRSPNWRQFDYDSRTRRRVGLRLTSWQCLAISRLDNMKRNLETCVPSWRQTSPNWRQSDYDSRTRRRELTDVRVKLEANESELETIRLRLTDAEKGLTKSKAEADTLRAQNATGSVNRDEDQITRRLLERMRALEVEVASKRWNEKSIEEMECRNEG
ncbi:hypothetical protein BGY98DRAFT_979974, partial [Russula aff. rugulosa BPL654]